MTDRPLAASASATRAYATGKVVLVVDDDPWIRDLLGLALSDEGYTVLVAAHGRDALDQIDSDTVPALIVLDWMMPQMNGPELARELARRGLRSRTRLLLLTAAGSPSAKAAGLGADACLAKPFDLSELLDQVARLVDR